MTHAIPLDPQHTAGDLMLGDRLLDARVDFTQLRAIERLIDVRGCRTRGEKCDKKEAPPGAAALH